MDLLDKQTLSILAFAFVLVTVCPSSDQGAICGTWIVLCGRLTETHIL